MINTSTLDTKVLAEAELSLLYRYHIQDDSYLFLDEHIKLLRKAQFGVDISDESVEAFTEAVKFCFLYQKAHADGFESSPEDVYYKRAQEYMQKHYEDIVEKLKK